MALLLPTIFFSSAVADVMAGTSRGALDIVVLPPESGNKGVKSNKDAFKNDTTETDTIPQNVPGKV